jgi:class 3 adenylate cyclase
MNCPDCSQANPEHARFCGSCGRSLIDMAPAALGRPGTATLTPTSDERRLVTVLFADVVGSTSLASRLDAEDWKAVMNGAFATLTPPIYRYQGTIPQFLGDGFLALFGAPVAHEDDAQRAVRAALEVIDGAERYAAEVRERLDAEFAIRIGIHTGPAVFGAVGTDVHREFLAVGETVNVASRLQARAEPMTALISGSTRRLLPDGFELDEAGPIDVRGLETPMAVFIPRRAPVDAEASARALSFASPMVGRGTELHHLVRAAAEARAGTGRVVLLLGEPGIGKSRLLREWRTAATEDGMRWAQASMPAHETGVAYRLAGEAVRGLMTLGPVAGPAELDSALESAPAATGVDGARQYLADLLSIPLPDATEAESLTPQGRQARYIEVTRAVARDIASEPLVLVLNDVHWSDPSSIALLIPLIALHAERPLLVCVTARPDRDTPGWRLVESARAMAGPGVLEIVLESLPIDATTQLLSNLLEVRQPPDGLVEFVDGRADGNPLFVEEIVWMLVDSGLLAPTADGWHFDAGGSEQIPETLQGLLAARIDRLDTEARMALRIASIIGRQFPVSVLERMLGWAT